MGRPAVEDRKASRDAIWRYARKAEAGFTVYDIMRAEGVERKTAASYLRRLEKAGVVSVEKHTRRHRRCNVYTLKTDLGAETPVLSASGSVSKKQRGAGRAAVWSAMRVMKRFELADIVASLSSTRCKTSLGTVEDYARTLRRAGYLRRLRRGNFSLGMTLYQLIENTGPLAPIVKRDGSVYDANEKRVFWTPDEEAADA